MAEYPDIKMWLSVLDKVNKDPEVARELKDVSLDVLLSFTDINADLSISINEGKVVFQEEALPDYGAKIWIASETWEKVVMDEMDAMIAAQRGLIEIDGSLETLINMLYLLPYIKKYLQEVKP